MPCHIELRNLALTYRWKTYSKTIFQNLNLCIEQGSFVTISGSNGSGKSTLVKLILGLVKPDAGDVLMDGIEIRAGYPDAVRNQRAAYLAQQIEDLFFCETVIEELTFGNADHVNPATQAQVKKLGLDSFLHRRIEDLSGGERQSLALAQFMGTEAPLLILDEPSSYLDQQRAEILREFIDQAHGKGRTILHVTQYPSEARWGSHMIDLDESKKRVVKI